MDPATTAGIAKFGADALSSIFGGDGDEERLAAIMKIFDRSQVRTSGLYGQASDKYQAGLASILAGFRQAEHVARNAKSSARQMVLGQEASLLGDASQGLLNSGNVAAYDVARGQIGYGTSKALVDIDSQIAQLLGSVYTQGGLAAAGQFNLMGSSLEQLAGVKNSLSTKKADTLAGVENEGGFDYGGVAGLVSQFL